MRQYMVKLKLAVGVISLGLVYGCTTLPVGPSVMVLPGRNKSFDDFRYADADCRNYALGQMGSTTADNSQSAAVKSAAVGAMVGAVAGALSGGNARDAGGMAGIGLLGGALSGVDSSRYSQQGSQKVYDNTYIQCMYAKGHRVPVMGQLIENTGAPQANYGSPRLSGYNSANRPPPPEGAPPPPPTH